MQAELDSVGPTETTDVGTTRLVANQDRFEAGGRNVQRDNGSTRTAMNVL